MRESTHVKCLLYVLLSLGLNIVVGYAGLLDLGYVAFFAIGAGVLAFRRARTTVNPTKPETTTELVTGGVATTQPGTPGSCSSSATACGNSCACPSAKTNATARPIASVITQALVP